VAKAVDERPETVPPLKPRAAVYGGRFALAYLLVIVAFGGMIGLFSYLVSRSDSNAAWSAYKPTGTKPFDRAQKIANHVGNRYLHQGRPIAVIDAQPPIIQNTVVDGIAVSRPSSSGVGGGTDSLEPANDTVMYVFCGRARGCGVPTKAAADAEPLFRRESLELALYTFKYVKGVTSIVTLLPPQKGSIPAIYLRRDAFEKELSKPLRETLPPYRSISADSVPPFERSAVETMTANNLFAAKFDRLPSGQAILVLGTGTQ
jgi:hypothetical protein